MNSDARLRRLCDDATRRIVATVAAYSQRPTPELIDALRAAVLDTARLAQAMVGAVPAEPSVVVSDEDLRDTRPGFKSGFPPRRK